MSRATSLALLGLALATACTRPSPIGGAGAPAVGTSSGAPSLATAASRPPAPLAPDATFSESRYTLRGARPVTPPGFTPVLYEGGFSGLNRIDHSNFWAISDRGPNGQVRVDGVARRTIFAPSFTPTIYRLHLADGEATIEERIPLRLPPGKVDPARRVLDHGKGDLRRVTGLANGIGNVPMTEASCYDATGKHLLPTDPYGVDTEGVAAAPDGTFWLAEEYRPSILHAARDGTLLERIVPIGTDTTRHDAVPLVAILPAEYAQRRENRGFEGVAVSADGKRVWAALQSPLGVACGADGDVKRYRNDRLVELDVSTPSRPRLAAEYVYRLEPDVRDQLRVGDLVWMSAGRMLVLERDDVAELPDKRLYQVDLREATDVKDLPKGCLEAASPDELSARGIAPLPKRTFLDLKILGYDFAKAEGATLLPDGGVAIVDDNDFGVEQDPKTGAVRATGVPTRVVVYRPRPAEPGGGGRSG